METKHNGYDEDTFSNIRTQDDPYRKTDTNDIEITSNRKVKKQEFII